MSIPPRLIQTEGYAVLSGIQMVTKAGLESGVRLLVGSQLDGPIRFAELLDEHAALLHDKGVHTLIQPDARQAIAAMTSAYHNGRSAVGVFDALGVVDAAGSLLTRQHPLGEATEPGAILLAFGNSDSSVGQAAIALLRRAGWLVIEPALQDEVLSFAKHGLAISGTSGRPVALALPAGMIGGAATVACQPNQYPAANADDVSTQRAVDNADPQDTALAEARGRGVNIVVNPSGKDERLPLALIAIGRAFGWTRQAMAEFGLSGRLPILRLGVLAPLDRSLIERHTASCQRVLLLDPTGLGIADDVQAIIAESNASASADDDTHATQHAIAAATTIELAGDAGPGGVIRALRPWLETETTLPAEIVRAGLARFAENTTAQTGDATDGAKNAETTHIPARSESPPPGSSLVDVTVVLGQLRRDLGDAQHMLEQHRTGPIDVGIFGELDDTATRLLSRWRSLDGGLACDGRLAGAASAGVTTRDDADRSVVLMTSRRFFSLGVSAIADSVRAGRNAVYVIHTEDPAEAVGPTRRFKRRPKPNALDMQAVVAGINAGRREPKPSVTTIDPSDRPRMRRLLERLVLSPGVHVVIARRRRGPRYYRKAAEVHRKQSARRGYVAKQGCLVHCPEAGPLSARRRLELGILGVEPIAHESDAWTVSVSWSWHDETVMHALAEPAVGLAILERSQPERSRVVPQDLDDLPPPPRPIHAASDAWRATIVGVTGTAFGLTLQLLLQAGASMGYLVRSSVADQPTDGPEPRRADVLFTRHEPANAPHVPAAPGRASAPMLTATPTPGHADLLLGTELTEACRVVQSADSPLGVSHTYALLDTLVIPSLADVATGRPKRDDELLQGIGFDDATGEGVLSSQQREDGRAAMLPIARLAEWLWGHQRYAAWVYLGYLIQRGLIPLTTAAIESAGQRVLGISDPRSSEAIRVGRKLAVDPAYADRALRDDRPDIASLVRTLADDLAEMAGSRSGTSLAGSYQAIVQPLVDRCEHLPDALRRQIVTTAQRCVVWAGPKQGPAYCKRFAETLGHILDIDTPDRGHKLTRAAIAGLDRVMLIPDEVYLAALLTAPTRYRRDRKRLNLSVEQGDKISYVHLLRPEFDLFKRRIAFTLTLGERALKTVARLRVLRRIRPGWYRTQRDFRDLYLQTLADLPKQPTDAGYRHAIEIAKVAAGILGRGDVRRDSVRVARRKLEKQIASSDES
jgi:TPP-dependent indolepyruvate ferredoxin oxidoreductase alpha subunit